MLPLDISQVAGIEGAGHAFSILKRSQTSFRTPSDIQKSSMDSMQLPCIGLLLICVYLFAAFGVVECRDRWTR
jgi:hypothetical protein